ncbi:MAG: hypothetical protein H6842_01140 [Rhodospirillaceae bacterium]|nr:hypothetical protein [Rhodospirillaceae bacterium]
MRRYWGAALLAIACGIGPAAGQEPDWPALARQDLQAIHDVLDRDHPGPVIDPDFRRRLDGGLDSALARAGRVADITQYLYLLIEYANALPDAHLSVWGNRQNPQWAGVHRGATLYPGFVAAYRGGDILVGASLETGAPGTGLRLLGCGGDDAGGLAVANALRFQGDASLAADWVRAVPLMFLDQGQLDFRRPPSCRFLTAAGVEEIALHWRPVRFAAVQPFLAAAGFGDPPPLGGLWIADDTLWISLPTLEPSGPAVQAMDDLRAMVAQAPAGARIVFDLRGNAGGNSFLARGFAVALYGEPLVAWGEQRLYSGIPDAVRASPGNRAHFQQFRDALGTTRPDDPGLARYLDTLIAGIDAALAAGQPLADLGRPSKPVRTDPPPSAHDGQVIVVIDGRVFSSALLFVDLLQAIDDVTLVGWPTRAHGLYGEIREVALPGGWAWVSVSTKAFLSRAGGGGAVEPDIPWDGEIADTPGLQRWVLSLPARP